MRRRILVVDGDHEARSQTVNVLEAMGYEVSEASSARDAVAKLAEGAVACAVVDVQLDDEGGLDAIRTLREVCPSLGIIITSAQNSVELEAAVRSHDITYYHVKEFGCDELVEAVLGAAGDPRMKRQKKILVVDDDRDYQAAVGSILEEAGYQVVKAYTKEEGLEAVKRTDPSLIILDIMMTHTTDGFHFLYEIKSGKNRKKRPVLAISCISKATGLDFSPTKDEGYFPADDFLSKPVVPSGLLARIEMLLARGSSATAG